jgi:GNAT superfamily N-acetyltransferase
MIRIAIGADVPRIREIRDAVKENRLSDPSVVTESDIQRYLDTSEMWVWDDGGIIKGFSAADTRDGSVWALFVDPPYESHGIGRALLAEACTALRAAGHRMAMLSTAPGTRAERFYRQNGWEAQGLNGRGEVIFRKAI